MRAISRDLRTLFSVGVVGHLADGALLERFLAGRDEAAFEALVVRHGPMVWGVCRRVLGSHHDAEDAFQASFLVLARKAAAIRRRENVASWLYSVAYQTALKARSTAARRRARERQVTEMPETVAVPHDPWLELEPLLDAELDRLPDAFRGAIILCDLEGKSRREAAQQLGWPEGTLSSRLARGRGMLARRLARRGLTLSGGAIAAALSEKGASASVATTLVDSTVKAAASFAAGHSAAAGLITAEAASLAHGMLKTMLLAKLKLSTAVILALGLAGSTLATGDPPGRSGPGDAPPGAATGDGRAPRGTRSILEEGSVDTYVIERLDLAGRTLTVELKATVIDGGQSETVLTSMHITLALAERVRVFVGGEAAALERLRPGLRVNLWIDRDRKGEDGRKTARGIFGVVTRIDVLAEEPRGRLLGEEVKLDSPTVLQTLKQAVEDEFDAAASGEPFERFWKEALAKLHRTDAGNHRFVAGARDCKSCHTSHTPVEAKPQERRRAALLDDLTQPQRDALVTAVAVERSMRGIRQALEAHRTLVRDSKATEHLLEEIEEGVRALKQGSKPGPAVP